MSTGSVSETIVKRVRVGIAVEVEFERADQNAGSRVLEFAGSGLAP